VTTESTLVLRSEPPGATWLDDESTSFVRGLVIAFDALRTRCGLSPAKLEVIIAEDLAAVVRGFQGQVVGVEALDDYAVERIGGIVAGKTMHRDAAHEDCIVVLDAQLFQRPRRASHRRPSPGSSLTSTVQMRTSAHATSSSSMSGMVDTRRLDRLLAHAAKARAKVVLIGDDRQLPEIDAGGAFGALARALDAFELRENRRQHAAWERGALDDLRDGDVDRALAVYRDRERVVTGDDEDTVREGMVASWYKARCAGERAVMVAISNRDVADLNRRARAVRHAAGELGHEELVVGERRFAVGDEVLCLRNDRVVGVINSTVATVWRLDAVNSSLIVDVRGGARVELPQRYLEAGDVTHAYATTVHKAQGMTVDRTLLLGDDRLYREAGYVGLSRGRKSNHLYVVGHDRDEALELHAVERDPPPPIDLVAAALCRSAGKNLAINELDHGPSPVMHARIVDDDDARLRERLDVARREQSEIEGELASAAGADARSRALRRLGVIERHEAWLRQQLADPPESVELPGVQTEAGVSLD
jgi:hypothetical protein